MKKKTIDSKIFIGILLTADLSYQLDKSHDWKLYSIVKGSDPNRIQKIPYRQKEYLGTYFDHDKILWSEIALRSVHIREKLEDFFPRLRTDKLPLMLFNQQMIPL